MSRARDSAHNADLVVFNYYMHPHAERLLHERSAHGGGFLPSYAPRSDNACRVGPDQCNPAIKLKKKPTEYLRDMYFDTLVFTSEGLRHLAHEVGTSQLVIGTDHPRPGQDKAVDHILKAPGFTDYERRAKLGETAAKLLGIKL